MLSIKLVKCIEKCGYPVFNNNKNDYNTETNAMISKTFSVLIIIQITYQFHQ